MFLHQLRNHSVGLGTLSRISSELIRIIPVPFSNSFKAEQTLKELNEIGDEPWIDMILSL